jgi:hypothetical protein
MNDDLFDRELVSLGDRLEAAIQSKIAAERNNPAARVHLLRVNTSGHHTLEDLMLQTDHVTTNITDGPGRPGGRLRRRRKALLIGAGAMTLAFGGAAAAAGLFSHETVERGMPGGAQIFAGTNPSCTSSDGIVFDCVLATAPVGEPINNLGTVEMIVDEASKINGGCRSTDEAGMRWTCFIGQRAVDEQIISANLLGQPLTGPASG